ALVNVASALHHQSFAEHRPSTPWGRRSPKGPRVSSGSNGFTDDSPTASTMPAADIHELVLLDAVELSWKIRHREVSCVDVMRAFLAHIDRFNPMVKAIVSRAPDETLLNAADRRDEQLEHGTYLGWMHGFPVAVKDLA